MKTISVCTIWRSVSSPVLVAKVAKSFFPSLPRSTRRRHYMHQHLQPLSSSQAPFSPVDSDTLSDSDALADADALPDSDALPESDALSDSDVLWVVRGVHGLGRAGVRNGGGVG